MEHERLSHRLEVDVVLAALGFLNSQHFVTQAGNTLHFPPDQAGEEGQR